METLLKTRSICPLCGKPVEASYVLASDKVWFVQTCPEHGTFRTPAAGSKEEFLNWFGLDSSCSSQELINGELSKRAIPPSKRITPGSGKADEPDCPLHCGTCENHLQTACCVLIDITDRCNQHCPYCFAAAEPGAESISPSINEGRFGPETPGEPTLSEMAAKFDRLLELGEERPFNLHLSGGEPTVRGDLPEIIAMAKEKGFPYIQINTNGRRLALEPHYAGTLKKAGASVIYLQFDGTEESSYKALRGEPLLELKKQVIKNCRSALLPVVLVPTIVRGVNLGQLGDMVDFLLENLDVIKGIHFQPVSYFGRCPEDSDSISLKADLDSALTDKSRTASRSGVAGRNRVTREDRVTLFDIMEALAEQTAGKIPSEALKPIAIGHPLCCFSATFKRKKSGEIVCLHESFSGESKPKIAGESAAEPSQKSCCGTASLMEQMAKHRDQVLYKWNIDSGTASGSASSQSRALLPDFDSFIADLQQGLFTISAMAFMDRSNLDAERLKRCRVQQFTEDGRLIPFCAYNSLYR